jgi:hypothetical protein
MLKPDRAGDRPALTFRSLFRLVLDDTGLKPSTIAAELGRERSLMYKWLSGSSTPSSSYFPRIVEIVSNRTSEARKLILANDLRATISGSALPRDVQATVLAVGSMEELLGECLELAVMPGIEIDTGRAPATDLRRNASVVMGALVASLAGGIVWNVLNRVLGWPFFMGGNEAAFGGIYTVVWGVVTNAPIPAMLVLLYRGRTGRRLTVMSLVFTLIGGAAAFAFYSSGVRAAIEALGFSYPAQETIIVVIFGLALSVPALIGAIVALPRVRLTLRHGAVLLLPAAATLIAFLLTLTIDRPVSEVVQLRGFVVGFALRLTLFFSLFVVVKRSIDEAPKDSTTTAS